MYLHMGNELNIFSYPEIAVAICHVILNEKDAKNIYTVPN